MGHLLVLGLCIGASSCAVRYHDKKTGETHIIGFGHMVMKAAPAGQDKVAVVSGVDIWGFGFSALKGDGVILTIGYSSERQVQIVKKDARLGLKWPARGLLKMLVFDRPQAETKK